MGKVYAEGKQFENAEVYLSKAMQRSYVLEQDVQNHSLTSEQRESAFEELAKLCLDRLQVAWELKQQVLAYQSLNLSVSLGLCMRFYLALIC